MVRRNSNGRVKDLRQLNGTMCDELVESLLGYSDEFLAKYFGTCVEERE